MNEPERKETAQRALVYAAIALAIVVVLVLLWYAIDIVLLIFFSVLLAILLRAPANWIARHTPLSPGWALLLVGIVLIAVLVGGGIGFGKAVAAQTLELSRQLPEVIESIRVELRKHEWTSLIFDLAEKEIEKKQQSGEAGFALLGRGVSVIGSTFGALANVFIVLFIAAFLAAQPQLYLSGFVSLVAVRRRARIRQVLETIGHVLERWLVGQALLMLLVGVVTGTGLFLLGVPLALPLGILAGLLEFVPYFGPILAGVPAVLIAFSQGPELAIKVIVLYLIVQSALGYLVEPFVQHKAVYLPPALIIVSQILLGLLVGGLGLAVATPLAASAMVAVSMLYVEDVLGDQSGGRPIGST